ncbi:hypothetical protein CHA01nite_39470 [Chryseobacterium hagamense]|uniref:DUF6443 domain-containing protein n=2 Tax=Chryseobacterium hagamense TaxID=395935 RepID=A0A511YSM6_9FLAO|nr:hypothetical protein CHA01nite_39470 [Chryseobacterium hagamense]
MLKGQYSNHSKYYNWDVFAQNITSGGGGVTLNINNNILSLTFSGGFVETYLKQGKIAGTDYPGILPNVEIPVPSGNFFSNKGYRFFIIDNKVAIYHENSISITTFGGTISVDLTSAIPVTGDIAEYLSNWTSQNKVTEINYLSDQGNSGDKKISISYYDGLGRELQNVAKAATPFGKDLIIPFEYDDYGRKVKDFLPVPTTQNNGLFVNENTVNSLAFSYYNGEPAYSEKVFEISPLDRISMQAAPGTSWKKSSGHEIKYDYQINNTSDNIKKYDISLLSVNDLYEPTLWITSVYDNGMLIKKIVKDEEWTISSGTNNTTEEFTDKNGRNILQRKYINSIIADTYYIYDVYGNLTYIIPPLASDTVKNLAAGIFPDSVLNNLCYQYKYDKKNRLVAKKLPGKGWEYMVYDKADRLVATQDANLKLLNKWLFTKYDRFGRVLYTGISIDNGDRNAVQTWITNTYGVNTETFGTYTQSGLQIYYANTAYPQNIESILSVNYYDTYPPGTPAIPAQVLGQDVLPQDTQNSPVSTKSLPVASYVKNIEDDNWTKNYIWYDKKGRTIGTHSINHLGGYTRTETELDFAGIPKRTNTYHLRKQGEIGVTLQERFVYDGQNRLLQHYHKVDDNTEVLLAENTYNELSQLTNKKVGNNLQSIDYAYNIRGWLTGINRDQMAVPDLGGKLFSYKIKYNEKEGITSPNAAQFPGKEVMAKYNGNIAEVDWRSVENIGNNPSITPKRYGYVYDRLNRLTAGFYQTPNNASIGENTESLEYDLNGNITKLFRTSVLEYGSTTPTKIDDLEYIYDAQNKSNKLITLNDNSFNPTGYEGGGLEIKYDDNGNMTEMPDKGINKIDYNYMNLPNKVNYSKSGNESVIVNTRYGAGGEKLQKENTTTTFGINGYTTSRRITDYLDGFQYLAIITTTPPPSGGGSESMMAANSETGRALERQAYSIDNDSSFSLNTLTLKNKDLQFFPTAEGFYDYKKDQYIYQYKDHLGNSRISFARNTSGNLELVDVNDYYPFGMNHLKSGASFFGVSSYKNYKYNGKELQETGMYDYGARFYMSDIGKFGTHDPLSDATFQPYNYANNNPIFYNDPTGMVGEAFASTDVVRQKDGSYKVVGAYDDGDTNIYVVNNEKDKKRTGEVIGQTMTPVDFMSANNKDGSLYFDKNETGVTFNLNNLTVSGTAKDKKGRSAELEDLDAAGLLQWIKQYYMNTINGDMPGTPYGWLQVLRELSANGSILDVKVSMGLHPYTAIGNGKNSRGKPIITTLRAMGNMGFGANMLLSKPPIVGKDYWYGVIMNKAGQYNQSQNGGNGYNAHYPYFGEHSYSGSYIYFGYYRQFYKK